MPSNVVREDFFVTNSMGVALSGASVYVCTQPANTASLPPSPLATVYTDSTGTTTLSQPLTTDGFGHAFGYLQSALYTIVYSHPSIGTIVYVDQNVNLPGNTPVAVNAEVPTGSINGTNTAFVLSAAPNPATSLQLFVNGVFQIPGVSYSISGTTITMTTAPHTGNTIYAIYNTSA